MNKNQKKEEPRKTATADAKPESNAQFVIDFKDGPIVAKVWLVDGFQGNKHLCFSLPRYYKSKSDRWIPRRDYFARNKGNIVSVVEQASDFCSEHESSPEGALAAAEGIKNERLENKDATRSDDLAKFLEEPAFDASNAPVMQ